MTLSLAIEGIAFWSPTLPDWAQARLAFQGIAEPLATPVKRPAPSMLPAAERRRATDTVALALEVASAAARAAERDPATMRSVFVSCHGDLSVNDYMCSTLATTPTLLSPTKFHNSVHNATAGYWTMGAACHASSTALTGYDQSFAAGLLQAGVQAAADGEPVLLVCYDIAASGALASVTHSTGMLAAALVLAPTQGEGANLTLDVQQGDVANGAPRSLAARSLAGNAMSPLLPFFELLATGAAGELMMPLGRHGQLLAGWRPPAAGSS